MHFTVCYLHLRFRNGDITLIHYAHLPRAIELVTFLIWSPVSSSAKKKEDSAVSEFSVRCRRLCRCLKKRPRHREKVGAKGSTVVPGQALHLTYAWVFKVEMQQGWLSGRNDMYCSLDASHHTDRSHMTFITVLRERVFIVLILLI